MSRGQISEMVNLDMPQKIHIVGIGGAGMRSIANVLADMGHSVSGSDLKYSPGLDQLRGKGIDVQIGHAESNIGDSVLLTKSTAIPDNNPEVVFAKQRGTPVLSRAQIMSAITTKKRSIVVSGTHGKTTTSSILSVILAASGAQPSFLIGGDLNEIGCGALWNAASELFVVEGDESDGSFLELESDISIITSIESDHLSFYKSDKSLKAAFQAFAAGTKEMVYLFGDTPATEYLRNLSNVRMYGEGDKNDYKLKKYRGTRFLSTFEVDHEGKSLGSFKLASPGLHNALNATAAISLAADLGFDIERIQDGISQFAGVARRFQYRGEKDGVSFVDDYAHLPTEIEAAIQAAKEGNWNRIVAVFQPHRYTRTNDLAKEFAESFDAADEVIVTGIYPAGEKAIPGVTGKLVADAVASRKTDSIIRYCEHREELICLLDDLLEEGDLCLTLGAGDLTNVPSQMLGS